MTALKRRLVRDRGGELAVETASPAGGIEKINGAVLFSDCRANVILSVLM